VNSRRSLAPLMVAPVFGDSVQRQMKPGLEPVGHAIERFVGHEGTGECRRSSGRRGKVVPQHGWLTCQEVLVRMSLNEAYGHANSIGGLPVGL
jgi:hypothetical protein